MTTYSVRADWDEAARVWATDGEDIPGLFCEADTFDELVDVVLDLAPDLLRANGLALVGEAVDIVITAERRGHASIAA